ncbi:MAG: hypothetical protein AB7U82_14690 [Blastocatellales bacterium]
MKKKKLIFSSLFLALALAFVSVGSTTTYADTGDPQGGTEKKAPPPPPPPTPIEVILAILSSIIF